MFESPTVVWGKAVQEGYLIAGLIDPQCRGTALFRNVSNVDSRNFPEYLNLPYSRDNFKSHTHFQNCNVDLPYVFLVCCDDRLINIVNFGLWKEARKKENREKGRKNEEREKKGVPYQFHVPDGHLKSRIQGRITCANFYNLCSYCRPRLYGIMWNEKNFEESRRILRQNLPGVNQFMKSPSKGSHLTKYFS